MSTRPRPNSPDGDEEQMSAEIAAALNSAQVFGLNERDSESIREWNTNFFGRRENEESSDEDIDMESIHSDDDELDDPPVVRTEPTVDILTADDATPMTYDENSGEHQTNAELEKIRLFKRCRCARNKDRMNPNPCTRQFDEDFILNRRIDMCELTVIERKMFIIGVISSTIQRGAKTACSKRKQQSDRVKTSVSYKIENKQVCRESFQFIHCISNSQLTGIMKSFKTNGVAPPKKKSGGRKYNKHSLSYADIKHVVTFITNYGERHGLALPGKTVGVRAKDSRIRLLPTSETKSSIFRAYDKTMTEVNSRRQIAGSPPMRVVKRSTFNDLWRQYVPFVKIMKPRSDVCWRCQQNNSNLYHSANASDASKRERVQKQMQHLEEVQRERELYLRNVKSAKEELKEEHIGEHAPCSTNKTGHYSFDFAQQVLYPADPLQPGPVYFVAQRKCALFGVAAEGLTRQVNYLIDEAHNISKGSNGVMCYLHDFFRHFGIGEKDAILNCDNCVGQNKNNYVLWYFAWRCMSGLHDSVYVHYMIAGHTKFSPDAGFGLVKQKFARTFVSSLTDLVGVVNESSFTGVNIPRLVGDEAGNRFVVAYDWHEFLRPYFKPLPHITKYHHFRLSARFPGKVFVKELFDSPELEFQLLKDTNTRPPVQPAYPLPSPGLSAERQWYLYESCREFCKEAVRDLVCPKPLVPKPGKETPSTSNSAPPAKANKRKASKKAPAIKKQKK